MILKSYVVPGHPHILLAPDRNEGWAALKQAYAGIAADIAASGAELLVVYSTQWFSVIGHLFQVDPNPRWLLVDQNWYEFGEIPYSFRIDAEFGKVYASTAKARGLQTATVNYHGFPIDTGSVVALKLLDPESRIPASIVSCNIYAEREETRLLGQAGREAINHHGKKTIVVCVTSFSNRYETSDIDPAKDRISSAKDDEWNRKLLEILGEGRLQDVAELARDFSREANADMNFKAIWWLAALMGEHNRYDGRVLEYRPVWGTGAALVELVPSTKTLEFEKEFDESTSAATDGAGTGLTTHNVMTPPAEGAATSALSSAPRTAAVPAGNSILTEKAAPPVGPYPHARRVGSMLYLSGIGPRTPDGEIPGVTRDEAGDVVTHDIEVQTRSCIQNVITILGAAGSSIEKVVDVTVFLTDMKRDFPTFNRIYAEYFGTIQPTRTTVGVDSLPTQIAVELKVIANE